MRVSVGLLGLAITALLEAGCGSSGDDKPESCNLASDRQGTYLLHFVEASGGTCGPAPDLLGRADNSTSLPDGCALDADDRITENGCKLERSYSCIDDADGYRFSYVVVTTQLDESGQHISGKMTMTAHYLDGSTACVSTYSVTATRQ